MINYRIISRENYSNKIGELVTMLEHTRDVTLSEISNLNQRVLYLKKSLEESNDNYELPPIARFCLTIGGSSFIAHR
ncbi:hypothetical protein [Bacillus tropicus]|uniref:hypothetical protein n=1 Tax=Bacillus tropicus TaxID=2026188 RepID=UPI000BEBE40F|nr:hypothetical protein CON09_06005 [Bacillus anthracis]PEY27896.1 hypothetical protein CN340_07810 [Bacillus anthracis]